MLHLQTVASNSHVNKMDASNLARILGPTILGYSSNAPEVIVSEAQVQQSVVSTLIGISSDYWSSFLAVDQENILNTKSVTPEKRLAFNWCLLLLQLFMISLQFSGISHH